MINPFGLNFSEITASSLLKVDSQRNVIEKGSTRYGLLKSGFLLHSCIHEGRKDINAANIQFNALAASNGYEYLVRPPQFAIDQVRQFVNSANIRVAREDESEARDAAFNIGEMEFEAEMRRMDVQVTF
jgi:hypothetical protein